MNLDRLDHILRLLWMLVMTVWLRRSNVAVWIVSLGWVVLLFNNFNGPQLIPRIIFIRIVGAILTTSGLVFAVWARFYLGSSWDAFITFKLDHKLIRTGPYAIVRHPISVGFMLALIGSVLNFGHLRSVVAATMVTSAWTYKAGLEESFMMERFGSEYEQYCHHVKKLIPKIW